MGASLWQHTATLPSFPPLTGETRTAVAVVGGGLCGLLTAYRLTQSGITDIAVLDANDLCNGMSAHTTAKITWQHGAVYQKLIRTLGKETARRYAETAAQAVRDYRTLIHTHGFDCDFTEAASVLYAETDRERHTVETEARAYQLLWLSGRCNPHTELPFAVKQALWVADQAHFHPLKFAAALIAYLNNLGVRFYPHSPVGFAASHSGTLVTPKGSLTAEAAVLTTHYPPLDRRRLLFTRLYQQKGYLMSFKNVPPMQDMYRSVRDNGGSFRGWQNEIIYGFGGHRAGLETALEHYSPGITDTATWYPGRVVTAVWSAQDIMTHDALPFIGQHRTATHHLGIPAYYATGFNRWGMTGSMMAAGQLAALVRGDSAAPLYAPGRWHLSEVGGFVKENAASLWRLGSGYLAGLPKNAALLPPGEGGVFRLDGKRIGVYKDEGGTLYAVKPVCPHLGCPLTWNREEKTWDCPCHGSRFTPQGARIHTPAPHHLHKEELP